MRHSSTAASLGPHRCNTQGRADCLLIYVSRVLIARRPLRRKHPHRDAEIFSYVVDGRLTHQDSLGNSEALGRGAVQYMSAGTGVVHSELNASPETCRFVQARSAPRSICCAAGFMMQQALC